MPKSIPHTSISPAVFRRKLLEWHSYNDRQLPWKQTRNAYTIWLSEIILQQTTVQQGTPYYEKFVQHYPTVQALAAAPLDEVLRLWQGLGYYARARNMHSTAQSIVNNHKGVFPATHKDIAALKGIGPYTAAAIASFAYGLPHAVVDGNVIRVLARVFGITEPVDNTEVKQRITALADALLDTKQPAAYNQAIMDFGALQCTPHNPQCTRCPFNKQCYALQHEMVDTLPVKKAKAAKKVRYFHFLVITDGTHILLHQRTAKDVWHGLHTFPAIEHTRALTPATLIKNEAFKAITGTISTAPIIEFATKQELSHQRINGLFFKLLVPSKTLKTIAAKGYIHIPTMDISKYALPKIMLSYMDKVYL